jgi:hypothetical protein
MNLKKIIAASFFITMLVLFLGNDGVIADAQPEVINNINAVQVIEEKQVSVYDSLNHQQQVWINALEWCESKGIQTAINPNDLDNTPSYYSFQFKPSTFKYYGEKYKIIPEGLSDSEISEKIKDHFLQREIVSKMLNDKSVNLRRQFPACVRSLGLPKQFFTTEKSATSTEVVLNNKASKPSKSI